MALSDRKITDSQISTNGVVSAPDELKGTIPQNKAVFDKLIKETVKTQLNGLIDDLIATTAAAQIGASAPAGLTGANIQALINALNTAAAAHTGNTANPHTVTKAQVGLGNVDNTSDAGKPVSIAQQAALDLKVDKAAGKGLSTNDYDNAEKAKVAQIGSKANTSDVLTKTNTTAFTPTADYHPCTKVYADNIAAAAGSVTSVFGRAGAVTAQTGDYTPEQVGAAPTIHTHAKSQIDDFAHTHAPTDLTSPIPLYMGGTDGSDVFQGSYNLRREVAVGVPGSVSATGWFLIGEQSLDTAFTTAGTVIAVNGGNELGSGILKLHTRVEGTAGVLNTSISKLTWMCTDGKINPEHFAIDASSGTLKLYVYITGGYRLYMFSILDEFYAGNVTNRSRAFNMTRNYDSPPVVNVNYLTSITKTLVSTKEPTNYVQSTSPTGAVAGDLWAW